MKKHSFSANSIFVRLFLSFLIIMITFEITGIIMFTWGQNTVQKEIEDSAFSQLAFLRERFEDEIFIASTQLERLISLTDFRSFSFNYHKMNTSEFYMYLREQLSLIKPLPENYPILDDVVIYYRNFSKSLSAKFGYVQISDDSFDNVSLGITKYNSPIKTLGSKLYIGMMYPIDSVYKSAEPRYIIAMFLSKSYIENFLSDYGGSYDTVIYNHTSQKALYEAKSSASRLSMEEYNKYFNQIEAHELSDKNNALAIQDDKYYILTEYSPDLNYSFIQFVPLSEIMSVPRQYSKYLIIFTCLSAFVLIYYSFITQRVVTRPVYSILDAFKKVESGNFDIRIDIKHAANEFNLLSKGFNSMAKRLAKTIDQLYKQEIYSQRMELKQLQMQINPHFLYNSYFVLHRLVMQEDLENAKLLSSYMGKYFQYITRNGQDKVPLQQEWDHAKNYMEIQSIRYSIRIAVKIDSLPKEFENILVPRLILQPILENAFEHGLHEKLDNGLVHLQFAEDDETISLQVCDNGDELSDEDIHNINNSLASTEEIHKETTALINIHRRLQLEFGTKSGLSISRNSPCGLLVRLKIHKSSVEYNRMNELEEVKE